MQVKYREAKWKQTIKKGRISKCIRNNSCNALAYSIKILEGSQILIINASQELEISENVRSTELTPKPTDNFGNRSKNKMI